MTLRGTDLNLPVTVDALPDDPLLVRSTSGGPRRTGMDATSCA